LVNSLESVNSSKIQRNFRRIEPNIPNIPNIPNFKVAFRLTQYNDLSLQREHDPNENVLEFQKELMPRRFDTLKGRLEAVDRVRGGGRVELTSEFLFHKQLKVLIESYLLNEDFG
jgi:hypothetical protein